MYTVVAINHEIFKVDSNHKFPIRGFIIVYVEWKKFSRFLHYLIDFCISINKNHFTRLQAVVAQKKSEIKWGEFMMPTVMARF